MWFLAVLVFSACAFLFILFIYLSLAGWLTASRSLCCDGDGMGHPEPGQTAVWSGPACGVRGCFKM